MAGWIAVALEDSQDVPEPSDEKAYSGRVLLRMAKSLHPALAHAAEQEASASTS